MAPKCTALVGIFEASEDQAASGELEVVAGCVAGKGWVESEQAKGLMRKGNKLSLYTLADAQLGDLSITSVGVLDSETVENCSAVGLRYQVTPTVLRGKEREYQKAVAEEPTGWGHRLLAVWHSPGTATPKWVTARPLGTGNTVYRKVIADWLKAKGVSDKVASGVTVDQILKADMNDDSRDEVFLSFRTPDTPTTDWRPEPSKHRFSYLLMRYLPRGSRDPKIIVLDEVPYLAYRVIGLCDLDGDGCAEVVEEAEGVDQWAVGLHQWAGSKFTWVSGCGVGA
jgi:hypothetical protein